MPVNYPPVEYDYSDTRPARCIEIKVPVVIAERDVEQAIDNIVTLPELAQKVEKIIASVRDLRGVPVFEEYDSYHHGEHYTGPITKSELGEREDHRRNRVKKVVVTGTVHKQIFYVNKNNEVRHTSEDLTFSKLVELREPSRVDRKRDVFIDFKHIDIDINWELQRASRLHETVVVSMLAKVVEDRQIFVQTCPKPRECPQGNLLRDGGIESWADAAHPVFWGATNVAQATLVHSGSFAAEIGRLNTLLPGSLFQMVHRGVVGGRQYRLTFWAGEDVLGGGTSDFTLTAEVLFFDEGGVQMGVGSQSLTGTGIPDNSYAQVQFITPVTDERVHSALVRFSFTPGATNTNTVKIDDVMLECMPMAGGF